MVLTCDKYPKEIDGLEERLKSRLGCGLVADIHPTTYELRLGILIEKAQKRGVEIPAKVLEFISHRIISNVREMEGALNRLVAHATLVGTAITVETAQLVLQDLLKSSNKKITIEEIQTIVPNVDISILDILKIESSVSKKTSYGGTAPDNVLRAIKKAKQRFLKD